MSEGNLNMMDNTTQKQKSIPFKPSLLRRTAETKNAGYDNELGKFDGDGR